jgi:hypothetical protein
MFVAVFSASFDHASTVYLIHDASPVLSKLMSDVPRMLSQSTGDGRRRITLLQVYPPFAPLTSYASTSTFTAHVKE